ncbi:MAG: DUF3737 family protein [Lachnospiraceae bacterium]|nr:DUF3737 family protein [Lachnospiraceae bacterium]
MEHMVCGQVFDEERALYNIKNTEVRDCTFAGPADGESVLKETRNVLVKNCDFSLRYPLWHARGFELDNVTMDELTRAAIWYSYDGVIKNTKMGGIKALRECENIRIEDSSAKSPEFGWRTRDLEIKRSEMESEYFLFECKNVTIDELKMKGKYSFQYVENMTITNSYLDTKDAFWHGKNITVKDSVLKGEYLAWFAEGLTLINCKIIGTQPLCYCKDLKLINCTMEETDLSFEYSDVEADVKGHIISVKNPKSGTIIADSIGEIIWDDPVMEVNGKVIIRE